VFSSPVSPAAQTLKSHLPFSADGGPSWAKTRQELKREITSSIETRMAHNRLSQFSIDVLESKRSTLDAGNALADNSMLWPVALANSAQSMLLGYNALIWSVR
jgi:hypothetical protein